MTTPFQPQSMAAIPAQPPAYSLLIAADTTPESAALRDFLGHGASWAPEEIGGGFTFPIQCRGDSTAMGETANPVPMTAEPFGIGTEDHCSLIGGITQRDWEGRARRQLEATQSFLIAREFQLGAARDTGTLANYALTDATKIHDTGGGFDPVSPAVGVALLEAAIGDALHGRRAMIHVTPATLTLLGENGLLTKAGQRWLTPMGSIVAADAGYTTDKDGYVYAYATAPVQVLLGSMFLNPGSFEEAWNNGGLDVDRTNRVRVYAEKAALILFDGGITTTAGSGTSDAMFKVQLNVTPGATHS